MIIPVVRMSRFFIKTGAGSNIHLTAHDRLDACRFCRLIKINAAKHDSMVCYGCTVHSQLLYSGYIFIYFIGTVQQTVFRMYM